MASRVGTGTTGAADGASGSIATAGKSTTTGNCIVVFVKSEVSGVTVTSVTDTAGNTYTIDQQVAHSTGGEPRAVMAYATNIVGNASNVVTATFSAGTATFRRIIQEEFSGIVASSPIDGTSTNNQGTGTTFSSGAITTTQSGLMVAGVGGFTTFGTITATGTPIATLGVTLTDTFVVWLPSTTAQSITPGATVSSGSDKWVMLAMALKDAPPPQFNFDPVPGSRIFVLP